MRSLDRLTIAGLFILGVGLCLANVWYAAERSTIPIAVKGTVTSKHLGTEKHPGVDDVCLVTLDDTRTLRIDATLFGKITTGDTLTKQAWQHEIDISGRNFLIDWSPDFHGLIWCMACAIVIMGSMIFFSPPTHLSQPQ